MINLRQPTRWLAVLILLLFAVSSNWAQRGGGRPASGKGLRPVNIGSKTGGRATPSIAFLAQRHSIQHLSDKGTLVERVNTHLRSTPLTSLVYLANHHGKQLLPVREERNLAREALRRLANKSVRPARLKQASGDLADLDDARDCVEEIGDGLGPTALALRYRVGRQALTSSLARIARSHQGADWGGAAGEAEGLLDHLMVSGTLRRARGAADRMKILHWFEQVEAEFEVPVLVSRAANGRIIVAVPVRKNESSKSEGNPARVPTKPLDTQFRKTIVENVREHLNSLEKLDESAFFTFRGSSHDVSVLLIEIPEEQGRLIKDVSNFVQRLRPIVAIDKAVRAVSSNAKPEDMVEACDGISDAVFPDALRTQVGRLAALSRVRLALEGRAGIRGDAGSLKADLDRLGEGVGDEGLMGRLRQDVAVKAMLDGRFAEARQLWPGGESPEHAASLMRDLKALMTGKGEVQTDVGRRAIEPEVASGGGGNRGPPPGIRNLLPEPPGDGWRPRVAESPTQGLPALQSVADRHETKWKTEASEALLKHRGACQKEAHDSIQPLLQRYQQLAGEADRIDALKEEGESLLGRPVTELELAILEQKMREGEDAESIARNLKEESDE